MNLPSAPVDGSADPSRPVASTEDRSHPVASTQDRSRPVASTEDRSTHELLRRLQLDVALRLDGLLHGDYRGLVPGHGSELGETRMYAPGDDVRRIDWNVTARLQDPHVRESIADRELVTTMLVDRSPSLDFGTASQEKRDLALSVAGAIGLLTARVGNRIGAIILQADGIVNVPARQGQQHLLAMLQRVAESPRSTGAGPDLAAGIHRMGTLARRRGLAVVVSDFLGPDTWHQPLRRLATRHDVLAVEIVDPRELELPDIGLVTLTDPETGAQRDIPTGNAKVRAAFAEAAAEQRRAIASAMVDAGAGHLQLRTDQDWLLEMARYVTARRTQRGAVRKRS